jgi:peptidoglycan/xylan/chitin deacetylase (PgdA/CDA1 family)
MNTIKMSNGPRLISYGRHTLRHWWRVLVALAGVTALFGALPAAASAPAGHAMAAKTVVSLTFDDGNADWMAALPILDKHQMKGTFYTVDSWVGQPNYVRRDQLELLAAHGNEIGGHTVDHPDLTTLTEDQVRREVCDDKTTLTNWGFPVTSFAYPFAAQNATVQRIVQSCGYATARGLGDVASAHGCPTCNTAEAIPPEKPMDLAAVDEIDTSWTLPQMQNVVTAAERNGGWVIFTFHHICDHCDNLSVAPPALDNFLGWLATRSANGTVVQTVRQTDIG